MDKEIEGIIEQWYDNPQRGTKGDLSYTYHEYTKLAKTIEQYVIKARIETAKRIKENVDTEPSKIWIMHYIAELKKGLKNE